MSSYLVLFLSFTLLLGQHFTPALSFVPLTPGTKEQGASSAASSSVPLTAPAQQRPPTLAETQLAAAGRIDPERVNADRPDWLPKLPNSCESDYECEGMESCCDFLFFKACCSDGHAQEQWQPVPIPVRPADGYYGHGGYGGYR